MYGCRHYSSAAYAMTGPQGGKIFEYRIRQLNEADGIVDITSLNDDGRKGWELVQVTRTWAWMKREVLNK